MTPRWPEAKERTAGLEKSKGVWFRIDVLAAVEVFQAEYKAKFGKRIYLKQLVNEALFDLVMRKKYELLHGEEVKFTDTEYDPVTKQTIKKPQ